jgi:putative DNA primase/helicase
MAFHPENIPDEVKGLNSWDCYRLEMGADGKETKVPYNPTTTQRASSTDPGTWVSFNVAKTAYIDLEHYDGICFFITADSGLVFIDLDNSITNGKIEPWAMDIVEQFSSYTEISQSRTGLHILIDGTKPGARCRRLAYPHNVEIYDHARQCCLTGDVLESHSTIEARQDALDKLYLEIFGEGQPQNDTTVPGKS